MQVQKPQQVRDGIATELPDRRQLSPVGTTTHLYLLDPPLAVAGRGEHRHVAVIPTEKATLVYPTGVPASYADYLPLAEVPGVCDPDPALVALGYRIAATVAGQ